MWCDTCGSSAFSLIPLRDEFKICSLNQETENSFVYSSLECFSIVLLLFGSQGRRHNKLYHSVFDVILVQLNEWIPVLLKCR